MKIISALVFYFLIIEGFTINNPSTKVTILQAGIDQVVDKIVPYIGQQMIKSSVPDIYYNNGNLMVNITDISIDYVNVKEYYVEITETGFKVNFYQMIISMSFYYSYDKKVLFVHEKGQGPGTASISDASALGYITITQSLDGNPVINTDNFDFSIGHIKVHLSGGLGAFLYNTFSWLFKGEIKKKIIEVTQNVFVNVIEADANNLLAAYIKSTYAVTNDTELSVSFDYQNFTMDNYFTYGQNVYFVPRIKPLLPPPYTPVIMPDLLTSSLIQIMISSASIESIGWAYYEAGALELTVTYEEVPELNTAEFIVFAPGLYKKYPNMNMSVWAWATQAPVVDITPAGITLDAWALLQFNVLDGGVWIDSVFGLNLYLTIECEAYISATSNETYLSFEVSAFSTKLTVNSSSVGLIMASSLNAIIDTYVRTMVIPKINKVGESGIPLPSLNLVTLDQPEILLEYDYLCIATDFSVSLERINSILSDSINLQQKNMPKNNQK